MTSTDVRDPALARLAARSAPLSDRLGPHWWDEQLASDPGRDLLDRWARTVTRGDLTALAQHAERLIADSVEPAGHRPPAGGGSEAWLAVAAVVIQQAHLDTAELDDPGLTTATGSPVPFAALYSPFLAAARHQVTWSSRWAPEAIADLERWLVSRLASVLESALEREFEGERRSSHPHIAGVHQRFVADLRAAGLARLRRHHPVLFRLACLVCAQWAAAVGELDQRLAEDAAVLQAAWGVDLSRVSAVAAGTSDSHHDGRSVHILTSADDTRIVYKPRDLRAEAATHDLFRWLSRRHPVYDLHPLQVLVRPGYGWEEHAEAAPCTDPDGPARFFRRTGVLLAVMHALSGTDLHRENLVAVGDRPVLVDAETVLAPQLNRSASTPRPDTARERAQEQLRGSVLATHLLPGWQLAVTGEAFDNAGLSGLDGRDAIFPVPRWTDVGADTMARELVETQLPPGHNVVRSAQGPIAPAEHVEDLLAGFRAAYDQLVVDRDALVAATGPLARYAGSRVRFLLRPTASYGLIALSALRGEATADGAVRSVALDRISQLLGQPGMPPEVWQLYRSEIAELERLDVPHFTVPVESRCVDLSDGRTSAPCLVESPLEVARRRVQSLSPTDRAFQERLVRGAFATRYGLGHDPRPSVAVDAPARSERPRRPAAVPALSPTEALARAALVGRTLQSEAVRGADGGMAWIGASVVAASGASALEVTGPDLYGGTSGIALFFAALASATGDGHWKDAARSAVVDLQRLIRADASLLARQLGPGGGTGTGSVIYALTALAGLLDDPALLVDATSLASAAAAELTDQPVDALAGLAGLVLGLVRLHDSTGNAGVLDAARAAGEALLGSAVQGPGGASCWIGPTGVPLAGISHGAAGIALAFTRLATATGDVRFSRADAAARSLEDRVYSEQQHAWPDLRLGAGDQFASAGWCHGPAGVGLARLSAWRLRPAPDLRRDGERALGRRTGGDIEMRDSLCCGALGRAVWLAEAGRLLDRPELTASGHQLLARVVARADAAGGYRLDDGSRVRADPPGLFRGLAGVGYALLLLTDGRDLPRPLTWE
jgi:type 2 lantibiotic biosynthesis protein LanM